MAVYPYPLNIIQDELYQLNKIVVLAVLTGLKI